MSVRTPERVQLGLFTGLCEAMYRPTWLHHIPRKMTERRRAPPKQAQVAAAPAEGSKSALLELPDEILAEIIQEAFRTAIAPPAPPVEAKQVGQPFVNSSHAPVTLYRDDDQSRGKMQKWEHTFTSPLERQKVFVKLALVCSVFAPHARHAFHSEILAQTTDAVDALAVQYKKDPGLARAVRLVRIRVGMILSGRQEHPPKRAAQLADILSNMEYVEHLECSRMPSPRQHAALSSTIFGHLRVLELEAPPSYWQLRPALDNMKNLKRLHLFLYRWESTMEEMQELGRLPPPPFQLDDFSLLMNTDSVVSGPELLHLLSRADVITKVALNLRFDKQMQPQDQAGPRGVPERINEVVRLVMEKYLQRIVDLSLSSCFTELMHEVSKATYPGPLDDKGQPI